MSIRNTTSEMAAQINVIRLSKRLEPGIPLSGACANATTLEINRRTGRPGIRNRRDSSSILVLTAPRTNNNKDLREGGYHV